MRRSDFIFRYGELERQQVEVQVTSEVLNRISALGTPESERTPVS